MLSTLFEEVGIDPKAKWFIAEGADLPLDDELEHSARQSICWMTR